MAPDLVDRRTLSSTGFHSVYIVAVWRLSNPRLVNLAITGASIEAYSLLPWPDSRNLLSLSLSVQGLAHPFAFSLQDSSTLISSTLLSYQVAWESSSLCRPSNRTLLAKSRYYVILLKARPWAF